MLTLDPNIVMGCGAEIYHVVRVGIRVMRSSQEIETGNVR
jgi:hypothetical protein